MAKRTKLGKLPPRYSFILNPYADTRLSNCPRCKKLTYPRKFAFLIHVDKWGPIALGKTCKYCTRCELIMMHQDELEFELEAIFNRIDPAIIGNEYLVIGTVEKKEWQKGLQGQMIDQKTFLEYVADFKKVYGLHFEPGGWYLPKK